MTNHIVICHAAWILIFLAADSAHADAISDDERAVATHIKALHDVKSETRTAAAEALRLLVAKYPSRTTNLRSKDGGKALWQAKADRVNAGMTESEVLKFLPKNPAMDDGFGIASGDSHNVRYRLDYNWSVGIVYRNPDKVIERATIHKGAFVVYVAAPKNLTGTWINWHVNGQKGYETQYRDGKHHGTFTRYFDNGKKNYEQHYVDGEAHGTDTGWESDGKVSYKGEYRNGKQDGRWIHLHANGIIRSETTYKNGEYDGVDIYRYENGRISRQTNYKNGVKHGIEACWKEDGTLQYERLYENGKIVE